MNTTSAKFNNLDNFIEKCDKEILLAAHQKEKETSQAGRKEDLKNKLEKIKHVTGKNSKTNDNDVRLRIGSCLIETNPDDLIPKDLSEVDSKYKKFQKECRKTSTSSLGPRQYKSCLLMTIRHYLKLAVPTIVVDKEYDVVVSTTKQELDSKLTKALFLYDNFKTKIRSSIIF